MKKLLIRLCCLLAVGSPAFADSFQFNIPTDKQDIPDFDVNGKTYVAAVTNMGTFPITNVTVRLNIASVDSAFNGDYYIVLRHNNKSSVLLNRAGRTATWDLGYGDSGLNITFDDHATNGDIHVYEKVFLPKYPNPLTGVWQPDGRDTDPAQVLDTDPRTKLLSQFNKENPNGTWSLFIVDNGAGGKGALISWGLDIQTDQSAVLQYSLLATVSGEGSINTTPAKTNFNIGENIQFLAVPAQGYLFTRWEGDLETTNNPAQLTITSNLAINARFTPKSITIADQSIVEGTLLQFDLPELESSSLVYQLLNPPVGATLSSDGHSFQWTPSEDQGPSTNIIQIVIKDSLSPDVTVTNAFTVIVSEINRPPVFNSISDLIVYTGQPLTFTPSVTDPDLPTNRLTFSWVSALPGSVLDSQSGAINWTAPDTTSNLDYSFTIAVHDDGVPQLSATQTFAIHVLATPRLTTTVLGGGTITIDPNQTNYSPGTVIQLSATPLPGYVFDRWEGNLQSTNNPAQLTIYSNSAVNARFVPAPISIADLSIDEEVPFQFQLTTNDISTLVFKMLKTPDGALFYATNRTLSWTPTEAQGPSTNIIQFVVQDIATPELATTNQFNLTVKEVNRPPTLSYPNVSIEGNQPFKVVATATDPDIPTNNLTFTLLTPLAGTEFDARTGNLHWTGSSPVTNTVYTVTVAVSDDGIPSLSATQSFTIEMVAKKLLLQTTVLGQGVVTPSPSQSNYVYGTSIQLLATPGTGYVFNRWEGSLQSTNNPAQISIVSNLAISARFVPAPINIADQSIDEEVLFQLPLTTNNVPTLSYQLLDAPLGAFLNSTNRTFNWKPAENQGPATNIIRFFVSDMNTPELATTNQFKIVVKEINQPPVLVALADISVGAGDPILVKAQATDADVPTNHLTFSLLTTLPGAAIDPISGVLTATAPSPATNTVYPVTIAVRDDGTPSLSVTQTFNVEVAVQSVPAPTLSMVSTKGSPVLWVTATAGHSFMVESSTNLISWSDVLQTNTTTALWSYSVTNKASKQFYRVRLVQ